MVGITIGDICKFSFLRTSLKPIKGSSNNSNNNNNLPMYHSY